MKNITLSDIAREVGVSRSTAARVLLGTGGDGVRVSEGTRQRIESTAQRLRYTPNRVAQQLRGISSKTIAVILDTVNTPVMSQRLFALEREASRRGYRLLMGQTHGDTGMLQEYISDFTGRAAEAALCLFDLAPGRDQRARAAFKHFKKVVFHGRPAWRDGYSVRVDTTEALTQCVDHLADRGRKKLALALPYHTSDELMFLREKAFESRVTEKKVKGIVWKGTEEEVEPTVEVVERGIDFMIGKHKAAAILASNDVWATRFILQLRRRGIRVPEDVAMIGYDNLDIASVVSPSLTTIDQCHEEYAKAALELLLELASGKKIPRKQRTRTVSPRLIIREST